MSTKSCTRCHEVKTLDAFSPDVRTSTGRMSRCKKCCAEVTRQRTLTPEIKAKRQEASRKSWAKNRAKYIAQQREYYYANSTPEKRRIEHLRKKFDMTVEQYEAMATAQDGRCAICRKEPKRYRLAVDHCHATGRVRGLLCPRCNVALGWLEQADHGPRLNEYLGFGSFLKILNGPVG